MDVVESMAEAFRFSTLDVTAPTTLPMRCVFCLTSFRSVIQHSSMTPIFWIKQSNDSLSPQIPLLPHYPTHLKLSAANLVFGPEQG